jgi:dihydroxyacetone kinase DhaKLM complex PTS-EIIA-like component DhaM
MGAGVTIVCQINNVFVSGGVKNVMKEAGLIEGASTAAAAAEDDNNNNQKSNKKKRKNKQRKEE